VIIGAPFEDDGHGAAFVYHGCATGLVDTYAQKLSPALLRLPDIRGFGYSFASRMDIDDNRYPGSADPLFTTSTVLASLLFTYSAVKKAQIYSTFLLGETA